MKVLLVGLVAGLLAVSMGCSSADRALAENYAGRCRVHLYSGGQEIAMWETVGAVENENRSDGFFFQDKKTGKLVRISGTVIIERL